ncbi:unnamed protein product [Sphagnum balticum]
MFVADTCLGNNKQDSTCGGPHNCARPPAHWWVYEDNILFPHTLRYRTATLDVATAARRINATPGVRIPRSPHRLVKRQGLRLVILLQAAHWWRVSVPRHNNYSHRPDTDPDTCVASMATPQLAIDVLYVSPTD